jgi:lipopolysaccharide/colanic/teichoic acid biosynthesis glycosyltransferase
VSPLVLLGAFAGGLAATWRDFGLWEDNSPPPPEVTRFVLEAHQARLRSSSTPPATKRAFDIVGAATGLVVLAPLAIAVCLLLWLEDPGPLFFVKNAVGRGGLNFRQWKLRTMVRGAETESGPVWSEVADQRVLRIGTVLRKTALDELPQLVNILAGQMSVVGPRPQRTVLVAEYLRPLPGYADRHRLSPGLAGLAQVAGHYYITPRQKLRFDRLYLAHAGLGFDLSLLAIAFCVVFWLVGEPVDRPLPRSWLPAGGQASGLEASHWRAETPAARTPAASAGAPVRCAWIQRSQVDQEDDREDRGAEGLPAIVAGDAQRRMAHTSDRGRQSSPTLPTKIARVRSSAFSRLNRPERTHACIKTASGACHRRIRRCGTI